MPVRLVDVSGTIARAAVSQESNTPSIVGVFGAIATRTALMSTFQAPNANALVGVFTAIPNRTVTIAVTQANNASTITGNAAAPGLATAQMAVTQQANAPTLLGSVDNNVLSIATLPTDINILQGSYFDFGPYISGTPADITCSQTLPSGVSIQGPFSATPRATWRLEALSSAPLTSVSNCTFTLVAAVIGNWATRSTGAGVLWAHDFSESVNELEYFTRYRTGSEQTATNPDRTTLPNPLTLVDSGLGSSAKAIVSQAVGTTITQDIAAAAKGSSQTISVGDASVFPVPASVGGPYTIFIGCTNNTAQNNDLSGGEIVEGVTLTAVNTATNTLTVNRWTESHNYRVDGIAYTTASGAPSIQGSSGNYRIGYTNSGSWNRPLCCFPAGQNGKATADIGITNGSARKTRTWNSTRNGPGHWNFREGYFGHRYYWDPAVGPALYKDWTPRYTGDGQNFSRADAYEGDEFYLQFRFKISQQRLQATIAKLCYIQSPAKSTEAQIFFDLGATHYNERPEPTEVVPGSISGNVMFLKTAGGDGRAAAGGYLGHNIQETGPAFPGVLPAASWHTDYPNGGWPNHTASTCYTWCHQSDVWVTMLLRFKAGRDNAEPYHPNGIVPASIPKPYLSASDATFRTVVEVKIHQPGWADYKTLLNKTDATWLFGDWDSITAGDAGGLFFHPPSHSAFWMTQEFNMYFGSGSICPPNGSASAQFTQAILSRNPIPFPT